MFPFTFKSLFLLLLFLSSIRSNGGGGYNGGGGSYSGGSYGSGGGGYNCQQDQYFDQGSNQCMNCPQECSKCSSSTDCTFCKQGYYISGNTCLSCQSPCDSCYYSSTSCSSCVDGYIKVQYSSTCQQCTKPCLTCYNSVTNCQSCVDSANQNPSSCDCQSGKYMDSNFYCQDCQNPCLTCSSASVCQSCEIGYLLSGNSCIPCTKPCLTCNTNVTTCSTCVDNVNQTPSSCNCNPGYIMNTSTYMCIQCTHPCATCQNSVTYCLTCASTYTKTSSTCGCASNQYETNTSPTQCINCSNICLTCSTSSTYCTSCDSSQHRIQSGNTCVCMDGYYDSNGNCLQCNLPCLKCSGSATYCTLCKDTLQILNDCHCPGGYFMDSSYICQSCQSPCINCSNLTNCLSCINTKYLSGTQCLSCQLPCVNCIDNASKCLTCIDSLQNQINNQCICPDGYYIDSNSQCQLCSHPCSKCQTTDIYCLECKTTFSLDSAIHQCYCQDGYYKNTTISPSICDQCLQPCATCQNQASQCLTCVDSNQAVNTSNQCICKQGWIANGNQCDKCHVSCTECQTSINNCTICKDPLHINNSGTCICQTGYVNDSNYNCVSCTQPCATCQTTTIYCLSCTDTNHFINTSNQCICMDTYYSNTISTCAACIKPCNKCDNNGCIDCVDGNQVLNSLKQCICKDGYTMIGVNCFLCNQPCKTCVDNVNKCLSCVDANQIIDNNTCICKDGYYSIGNICGQCQLPCTKCVNGSNICTECVDSNQIIVNQKCVCKNGFGIASVDQNYCSPCQYPCLECSLSSQTCTSCYDKGLFQLENNKCHCNYGYFQMENQCLKCAPQCLTCEFSFDNCTSCSIIQFNSLMDSCQCNFGYYSDTALVCKKCLQPCQTYVLNYDICTSCELDFSYLSNNKCICNDGYYFDGSICHLCQKSCSICQSLDICNQCNDGYYLNDSNQCIQCKLECKNCLNEQICLKCEMGFFLALEGNCKTCISDCEVCSDAYSCDQCFTGYFYSNFECQECNQNCLTCENSQTDCITCRPHYNLINQKCKCFDGYFERDLQCLECQFPCIQCLEINQCQQCSPQIENLYLKENNQCECEIGYFWFNNQCKKCEQRCLTCITDQSNCLSCDYHLNKILKINKCVCSSGYFEDDQFTCISCKTNEGKTKEICQYQDCSDFVWTYGEQCDDGNNVNRDGCSNCLVDPYYSCKNQILEKSVCFQSPPKCSKCSLNNLTNVTYCEICETGYYLVNGSCNKCDDKCLGCEETSIKCTKCRFQTNKQGQCVLCEYSNGLYSNYKTNQCESKCGDSILVNGEDCDDGNIMDGDGCSKLCKYEPKYLCKDGICITPQYPKPYLQSIGDKSLYYNLRQFQLTYDSQLRIDQNFELKNVIKLYVELQNVKRPLDYQYQINQEISQTQNTSQFGNLSLYINLTITNSSSNEFLIVYFENKSMIISQNGYIQQDDQVNCEISPVIILDQSTLNQVESASSSNSYMLYFIAAMAGCAILFGGIDIFYNLLDTLQMLSYFKYVNTQFPYNLKEFFNLFGFAQLSFISNYFKIQEYFDQFVDFQALPNLPQKISDDGLNPLFIINGSSILAVWTTLLGIYYISFLTPKTLNKIKLKYYSDFPQKQTFQVKFNLYFLSFKIFITKICFIIVSEFIYSGIIRAHISTAYDYSFSTLLQIYSIDIGSKSFIIQFSQTLAVLALFIYAFCVFMMVRISDMSKYSLSNPQNQLKYGSLFEGVVISKYSKYFNSLLLLKKIGFMIILIFTYYVPLIQIMNLILFSLIMVIFLIVFKPIEDRLEYVKQLSVDISMLLTQTFMAFLIFDDDFKQFSYEARQNIGWGCIACISIMLVIQIIVDAIQQWILLIKKFKALKRVVEKISKLFQKQEIKAEHNIFTLGENY